DPDLPSARRERARVFNAMNQFLSSAGAFAGVQDPSADVQLRLALQVYAEKTPDFTNRWSDVVRGGTSGEALRSEVQRIADSTEIPAEKIAMERLLLDYDVASEIASNAYIEGDAKDKKGRRNFLAMPVYESLQAVEPSNSGGFYDLGQVNSTLHYTRDAVEQYAQALAIDPLSRDAAVAIDRASTELNPKLDGYFLYDGQQGRDGLATINRFRMGTLGSYPLGDENEFMQLGYVFASYDPADDRPLTGNILVARIQKRLGRRLPTFTEINFEDFPDRLGSRVTFDTGATYLHSDIIQFGAGGFLNNVVQNGESLRQSIYRGGARFNAVYTPNRRWVAGPQYTAAWYSDENILHQMDFFSQFLVSYAPCQFKLVQQLVTQSFTEQTTFGPNAPNDLRGTIHPYFAPASFYYYQQRFEWKHWISRDFSEDTNQCWYELHYGIGFDDALEIYHEFKGITHLDLKTWLTVGTELKLVRSGVYNNDFFTAFVQLRYPCTPQ
ncbi:MAG: hypothetical protein ACRC1K_11735, partial [Planctomycetia bacterium]